MKRILIILSFLSLAFTVQSQEISIQSTLDTWKYEKLTLPLDFAPNITYQGYEELKFAPGMFDPKAKDYFSYVFLFKLENTNLLNRGQLKTLLENYYKGLFIAISADKKTAAKVQDVKVTQIQGYKTNYHSSLNFYDCFNQCQKLAIEIELEQKQVDGNVIIMASASAQPQSSDIWDVMRRTWYEMK